MSIRRLRIAFFPTGGAAVSAFVLMIYPLRLRLICAEIDVGAPLPGSATAPEVILALGLQRRLTRAGVLLDSTECVAVNPVLEKTIAGDDFCRRLASGVAAAVTAGTRFLVLGGDHSCATGTWRGCIQAKAPAGTIGLIWVDAHLDCHTPESSPSGARHGMPLAELLGCCSRDSGPIDGRSVLDPGRVCVIGVHSYEEAERRRVEQLGVRVYYLDEVHRRGLNCVMAEALTRVRAGTAGFGVTVDLDAVDSREAPGVTVPAEPGGLRASELTEALTGLARFEDWLGIEVVELNPLRDQNRRTAYLAADLAVAACSVPEQADGAALRSTAERWGAENYDSLPLVLSRGEGAFVWDVEGCRYVDMMGAYSAASHGHAHPRLVSALERQARRLAITSRAFHNDRLGPFLQRLCEITGQDRALPMNTGAEAVETALKAARRWAYKVKGVPAERANIIVCHGNFHGRTIAIVGFSSEAKYRDGFGPFPPGFRLIPFGDATALADAIDADTAAFLVEPIQGEGGIIMPPPGYLAECARICRTHNVLLLCDEIQTGLGRTGRLFAADHDGVKPDGIMLGKALGGGLLPVSTFAAREDVIAVFTPGSHGSTFGGNPLAAAVGLEALDVLLDEDLAGRSAALGQYLRERLEALPHRAIREIRGRGLFIGLELGDALSGREVCMRLLEDGVLTRETRGNVLRFAPPLVIDQDTIDAAVKAVDAVLTDVSY